MVDALKDLLKNKRLLFAVGGLILGLVLILAFPSEKTDSAQTMETTLEEYKEQKEKELAELCSSVKGVGRCSVTLSFKKGAENIYKGNKLTESKPPEVLGVIVVCRGADSDRVRAELTELFTALFDIPSTRIAILKLN